MSSEMMKLLRLLMTNVTSPLLIQPNSIVISFPRFCGEPDGGLLWDGENLPFAILEVGYSDGGKKTRSRSSHWLTRGAGKVWPSFSSMLMIQIKLSLSIKITAGNYTLQSIEVDSYKWSSQPLDGLATRSTIHGCVVHMEKLVFIPLLPCSPDFLGVSEW